MKRDSSPPEAILPIGPNGWPGLVQTSNATRSAPSGPQSASGSGSSWTRIRARSSRSGGSSACTAAASREAVPARALDSSRAASR